MEVATLVGRGPDLYRRCLHIRDDFLFWLDTCVAPLHISYPSARHQLLQNGLTCVEDPFSRGPKAIKALAAIRALLIDVLISRGCRVMDVVPSQWQSSLLKDFSPEKDVQTKIRVHRVCSELFNRNLTEDEADACGIALFGVGALLRECGQKKVSPAT